MALLIDVEQYCVFRANQAKLSNGHNPVKCPQCQALKRVVIEVNNKTLDMIIDIFKRCKPGVLLEAKEYAEKIQALKSV